MAKKKTLGLIEEVEIVGNQRVQTYALFDTGAKRTSIDLELASKAELGPVVEIMSVKNPSIKQRVRRPIVEAKIKIDGKNFVTKANLQDRSHMSLPVIIGRGIIAGNFVVDPEKNEEMFKKFSKKDNNEAWDFKVKSD